MYAVPAVLPPMAPCCLESTEYVFGKDSPVIAVAFQTRFQAAVEAFSEKSRIPSIAQALLLVSRFRSSRGKVAPALHGTEQFFLIGCTKWQIS